MTYFLETTQDTQDFEAKSGKEKENVVKRIQNHFGFIFKKGHECAHGNFEKTNLDLVAETSAAARGLGEARALSGSCCFCKSRVHTAFP